MGLGSLVCDDEGASGWGVVDEVVGGSDEVLCNARRCLVAGRWVAALDPRVGDRRGGDVGLEAAAAGGRRPNP